MPIGERLSSFESRLLVRVGLALWWVAALACVWEVLALQAPDSPLHLGVLSGPIAQLRTFSFALGLGAIVAGSLWPALYAAGEGRAVALLLALGALVHVTALAYAAGRGLIAVQALDPRADARLALYGRTLGHALTLVGLSALCVRALRTRYPQSH